MDDDEGEMKIMDITKESLNNLVNNLKKPLITGITSLDSLYTGNQQSMELSASYNDIIDIINNGNLPIIKITAEAEGLTAEMYYPIFSYGFSSTENKYGIGTIDSVYFFSDTQTGNLTTNL